VVLAACCLSVFMAGLDTTIVNVACRRSSTHCTRRRAVCGGRSMRTLSLLRACDHGTPIPGRHRGRLFGANISPALAWTTPPAETAELVLIVQDPDVPLGKPATHALTLGINPSLTGIPENGLTDPSPISGLRA
jgi:phosphatidylethanolamine-binding protein (PEBP) family uncharacterized protein